MKNLLKIIFIMFSSVCYTYSTNISIKLIFESGFSNSFQPGEEWENVDETSVKNFIISRVTTDFSSFGISVSIYNGNIIAYIGRSHSVPSVLGHAVSGVGSYISGSAYAEIYSNNFSTFLEWQGNNATISRIGEAIAGTTSHEIGHLINLYHAYMFDSFDPIVTGSLNEYYQPKEPELLPSACITDPNKHYHLLATRSYITAEQMATINRYFSANSSQVINFAKNGGYNVNRNITWGIGGANFYQENDVIINSDKTLILASGGYLHQLNGKLIKGGTIIKYGSVNNENIQLKSGYILKGLFSTIHSAISNAVSGQTIEIYNSHLLSENCTVPAGVILDIKSNASINLNGKYINCSGSGKIIKSGNVTNYANYSKSGSDFKGFYPSTISIQQIINWATSGWDIYVGPGTYTENLDMKTNVDLNGYPNLPIINGTITLNDDDNVRIEYLKVKNKIMITNSDNIHLNFRSDHPNCYVESINSFVYFYDPYFFQSQAKAFYGHDDGDAVFFRGSYHNKTSQGAYFHYWTYGDFTDPIFCNNAFDIYVSAMCYVLVRNNGSCRFTGAVPGSTVSPTVSYSNWTTCTNQLAKQGTDSEEFSEIDEIIDIGSGKSEFDNIMTDYRLLKSNLNETQKSGESFNPMNYAQELDNLKSSFNSIIEQYPESNEAILSLGRIGYLYRTMDDFSGLTSYCNNLLNDKKYNNLTPHILNLEKQSQIKLGKYDKALELSDQIINQYPKHLLLQEVLYGKGLIYKYYVNDSESASKIFTQVIEQYPKEMIAESAKEELASMGISFNEKELASANAEAEFSINNYPNPFNPTTKISFQLPEKSDVTLKVYDILGREIAELVNESREAGNHEVIFNAINLSSGIYYYKLQAGDFIQSKKMLLIK